MKKYLLLVKLSHILKILNLTRKDKQTTKQQQK